MTTFETKKHIEINEGYQGINLTEFLIKADDQTTNDQIVDTFIRSASFAYDSLRDCIKKEPQRGYLRPLFNIDRVKITDFRKVYKEETAKFLLDFIASNWGDDKNPFVKLCDRYFETHHELGDNTDFYVLSMDWFDSDDERLIEPEKWAYTYYFLIISLDRNSSLLTLTEWFYD
jgi:hypothetical protein